MKGKRNLIIGLFLGGILGWTLGFLRLPYLEKNASFLMGFVSCLALVLVGLLLAFVWNKNALLLSMIGKNPTAGEAPNAVGTYRLVWILVSIFIVAGGSISGFLIFKQNQFYSAQTQLQNEKIAQQSALMEANRKSNLIVLMNNLVDQLEEELSDNPTRSLSKETIEKIAALNYSFQPYRYLKGDSLSEKKLSPERGQLLVLLSALKMDSSSFHKIKLQTSFLGADLERADLSGLNLSGADLREAHLKDATLEDTDLSKADLRGANLWGSHLRKANLSQADLQNADLGWADLIEADLSEADLNGVNMSSAKLTKADLSKAKMTYAELGGAFFNEAKLMGVDVSYTNLSSANLSGADLSGAIMKTTNLSNAVLNKANLEGVNFRWSIVAEKNWFEKLEEWQVKGAEEIRERFELIVDESGLGNYRLPPKEN